MFLIYRFNVCFSEHLLSIVFHLIDDCSGNKISLVLTTLSDVYYHSVKQMLTYYNSCLILITIPQFTTMYLILFHQYCFLNRHIILLHLFS